MSLKGAPDEYGDLECHIITLSLMIPLTDYVRGTIVSSPSPEAVCIYDMWALSNCLALT